MQKFVERNSISIKLIVVFFLTIILMIPASIINELVSERKERQNDAIKEIQSKWGEEQTITGPILCIPYQTYDLDKEGNKINLTTHKAFFLPDEINITGSISPVVRKRDLFKVVLYQTKLYFNGSFKLLDFSGISQKNTTILSKEAYFSIGISDMRGVEEFVTFNFNKTPLNCEGGTHDNLSEGSGFTTENFDFIKDSSNLNNFSFELSLKGSENLKFIPFGKRTNIQLSSNWKTPSFDGAFLPDKREINDTGFVANWEILDFNRNFPQQWVDSEKDFSLSAFGVNLKLPIDLYKKTERSTKYAILFIALTFAIFFFIEVLKNFKVHPIQYVLIGSALCVFYLLLLSLSEQVGFDLAYLIASISVIGMIVLYAKTVFKFNRYSFMLSGILAFLYGFIYILLQMEDYALLIGSIGLFIILGLFMFFSRKINWYKINSTSSENSIE